MAQGVNKYTCVGNLGRDPDVRYTDRGGAVANMSVAIGERKKEGDTWKDHTEWVRVVAFGKLAELVEKFLTKGRQVYVEGRLQTRSYKDKDGVEKWSTEVVAREILFLGGPNSAQGGAGKSNPVRDDFLEGDDDLPF